MPDPLIAVPFSAELLDLIRDFSCGEENYERELADWIRQDSLPTLARGGKVWLYATARKELVGFGSVALTRWHYPEPSSKRVELAVIPAVAIHTSYRRKPDGPREERYSSQILDHLIAEAAQLPVDVPVLALFVHPDNQGAIKLYSRFGFSFFPHSYTDKATGVTYKAMIRPLAKAESESPDKT
jgi:ribosomal protein S18 acetylase RimI-like enzyme